MLHKYGRKIFTALRKVCGLTGIKLSTAAFHHTVIFIEILFWW